MKVETLLQKVNEDSTAPWQIRLLAGWLVLAIATGLLYAIWSLSPTSVGLKWKLVDHIAESGVSHPVTAVLLNFRGYDTLLEMGVLLLALIGMWSLAPAAKESNTYPPGPIQDSLTRLLVPLIILTAGYLLWAGAHAPGGAFQAGALLAAAGILLLFSNWHLPPLLLSWLQRSVLIAGIVVFIGVAVGAMWTNSFLLAYPPQWASGLIMLIEVFATLSIGATLVALFLGGRPDEPESPT